MSKIKTVLNTSDKFPRDVFTAVDMYRWSRDVPILQLKVSIQKLISRVVWGQTYNIGPCCNYFVDLYENNYILCWSILRLFC